MPRATISHVVSAPAGPRICPRLSDIQRPSLQRGGRGGGGRQSNPRCRFAEITPTATHTLRFSAAGGRGPHRGVGAKEHKLSVHSTKKKEKKKKKLQEQKSTRSLGLN